MQRLPREPLPLPQQRQWRHRALLLRLPRLLRRERPLRQTRKLRLEQARLVERVTLRHRRQNRPASAERIVMLKAQLRRTKVAQAKRRPNAPLASTAKLPARKERAKVAVRRRAKGVSQNRSHPKKRPPPPNQALLRNVA